MTAGDGSAAAQGGLTVALVLVATIVVLAVVVHGIRDILTRGEWRDGATATFVLTALSSSLIDLVVSFAGPQWATTVDPFGNEVTSLPSWAYQVQLAFYIVVLIASVAMAAVRLGRPDAAINVPALLFLLLTLASGASALLHGDNPVRPFYLVIVAILAAATLAPRGLGPVVGIATFGALAAVCAGLTLLVVPGFSTFACGVGKCGLLGFNFRGFLDNENALALYLTLAMPFVFLAFGRLRGWLICTYLLLLVLLSGSRTGGFAAIATYLVLLVVRPDLRRPTVHLHRLVLLAVVLGSAGAVGVLLPLMAEDPHSFTGRAHLWILARSSLSGSTEWMFGSGALGWQHVRDAGLINFSAVYSVHNQWLQVLYTTGLVGAALMAAALVLLIRQAGLRYASVIGCVLTPVVFLAITERPWSLDLVDWLSWALPGALLCYPVIRDKVEIMDETASAAGPASPEPVPGGLGADNRGGGLMAVLRRRTSETRSGS